MPSRRDRHVDRGAHHSVHRDQARDGNRRRGAEDPADTDSLGERGNRMLSSIDIAISTDMPSTVQRKPAQAMTKPPRAGATSRVTFEANELSPSASGRSLFGTYDAMRTCSARP